MFKKIVILISSLALFGCSKSISQNNLKNVLNPIKKASSYIISGTMKLYSDEETFTYDIEINYKKESMYIVSLLNNSSDKKQIILKNKDGLYVITPSLNKSFKFDSTWPNNSSQAYILETLVNDIESDEEKEITDEYIKCKVSYPNNPELTYEKIYYKDKKITKVEVYNFDDIVKIEVVFNNYNLNSNIKDNEFELNNFIEDTCSENCEEETVVQIDDAIYPLYTPANTYLNAKELVTSGDSSRVIMTFSGDKNYVIVEEASNTNDEMEVIPVYGSPLMINDTVAALSSNSIYWSFAGIDYYIVSDNLSQNEMITLANSLGNEKTVLSTTK